MALRFTVLASGSAGNASFLQTDGFGLLLDIGLGPRQLASRLAAIGASWRQVDAVLLTHTHSDHWNDRTLAYLRRQRKLLYCHEQHHHALQRYGRECAGLLADQLVRLYQPGQELALPAGLRCLPVPLLHDGGPTFGFRLEKRLGLFESSVAVGYAADLGNGTAELVAALGNVDLLALEFNHDVALEYASGRSLQLIQRVLSDVGHLSNVQAAGLLQAILQGSEPGRLQHVVQLHLSRDCNRPDLAQAAARAVLAGHEGITLHTASQHEPGQTIRLGKQEVRSRRKGRKAPVRSVTAPELPWLPGLEP